MALTKISTGGVKDDTADEAKLKVSNTGTNGQFLQKQSGNTGGLTWSDANQYTHPNHSGEVTSTADGATVIASNIVDEDNLKISNAGTNGQYLQKQSGNTGGLTWADVAAGAEITATADGAIAANKPVRLNEDGTISEIKNTALSAATGSNTDIPHQYDPIVKAAVWISSTKFVLFWIADDDSDKLVAAVGTASGTSISYGSRTQIGTDDQIHRVSAVYDSSIDVILLTYCTNNPNYNTGGGGRIKGLTVSGTTITVNSTGANNGDACHTVDIASDNKGGFIQMWVNKDGQWYTLAGTVTTAGAISVGSAVHIANSRTTSLSYNTMRMCYDKDSDAFVGVCIFNSNIDYSICTRSGTIVTETSASTPPTIISGIDGSNVNIVYYETELRFLIVGRSNSNAHLKYATPKMNSAGTALNTGGSGTLFAGAQYENGFMAYDKGTNKAFYIFDDELSGADDTKLLTITLNSSGTVTGDGSVSSEQLGTPREENQAIACNGEGLVLTAIDKSDDSDVLSRLKQLAITVSNLKADSFIGFSSAAISDSASGSVNVVSNTTTQSGLTPSKKYYVQKGGTLSTAADDPSVVAGIALSSTKLLIKG